ncbi:30S ribosomal protein S8 [Candidatus Micrarchaeota archaeon]|nr:30S ribosomal protein S8 [Candidatus Micrarchaeota archaeon]
MFMTDHLADALNTIKTHEIVGQDKCTVKATKLIAKVLEVLKQHNYLKSYTKVDMGRGGYFEVELEGKINDCGVIKPRIPVRRHDWNKTEEEFIPAYNIGLLIVSTPGGIMTNADARQNHTGGRLLAYVY